MDFGYLREHFGDFGWHGERHEISSKFRVIPAAQEGPGYFIDWGGGSSIFSGPEVRGKPGHPKRGKMEKVTERSLLHKVF